MQKEHPELIPAQETRRQFLEKFTHNFSTNLSVQSSVNIFIPIVFNVVHDNGDDATNIQDLLQLLSVFGSACE